MKLKYKVGEQIYNVKPEDEAKFLEKNPNAVLVTEEPESKQEPTVKDAPVEESTQASAKEVIQPQENQQEPEKIEYPDGYLETQILDGKANEEEIKAFVSEYEKDIYNVKSKEDINNEISQKKQEVDKKEKELKESGYENKLLNLEKEINSINDNQLLDIVSKIENATNRLNQTLDERIEAGYSMSDDEKDRSLIKQLQSDYDNSIGNLETKRKEYDDMYTQYSSIFSSYENTVSEYNSLIKEGEEKEEDPEEKFGTLEGFFKAMKSMSDPKVAVKELLKTRAFFKNIRDNIPENLSIQLASAVATAADVFTADLDGLGYNEKQQEVRDKAEETIVDIFKGLEKIEEKGFETPIGTLKRKDTGKGFVEGAKSAGFADIAAAAAESVVMMGETVIPAMLTYGASLPAQIAGPMYVEYNKEKAKSIYGEDDPDAVDKLIKNGESEIATPLALAIPAMVLEKIGYKGVMKHFKMKPLKLRGTARVVETGNKEGLTELFQGSIEAANRVLGSGGTMNEASLAAYNVLESVTNGGEGLELYLRGFTGSGAVGFTGNLINRGLRSDNSSLKELNTKIEKLAELNTKKRLTRNKDVKNAIDLDIKATERDLKNYVESKRKIGELLSETQKSDLITTLNEKDNISKKVESLKDQNKRGQISNKELGYAIRGLNNRDLVLSNKIEAIKSDATKAAAEKVTKTVEKQIEKTGLKGKVTQMTSEEIKQTKFGKETDSIAASKEHGFIRQFNDGTFEIVLNTDKPMEGTAAHEFMHAVLYKTIDNQKAIQDSLGNALLEHVNKLGGDKSALSKRLSAYGNWQTKDDGSVEFVKDKNFGEETITIMSESILDGSLKFDDGFFTKIGDAIRRFSQNYLGKEIKFNTGKDVYNFIKDYTKSIKEGKIDKAVMKVAKEGAKGKLVEGLSQKDFTKEEVVQMSKDAKPEVDELGRLGWTKNQWKTKGANFAMSEIQANGLLDRLIASKLKVPMSPTKTKEFIQKVYSELTPHAKNFNPEVNDSFFGWINSQISNKAGNVYNREYKVVQRTQDIDARTTEGAPVVQVEADTSVEMDFIDQIGLTEEQTELKSRLRRDLGLDIKMMDKVRAAVVKTFGTKLPNIESKDFIKTLQKAFRTELKKPIQDMIGSKENYTNFLQNNFKSIFNSLPVSTLIQMERSVKPENRIFTTSRRITKVTEVDKLISQGKLPKDTNRKSGPQLHNKNKYPGTEKVLAFFRGTNMQDQLGYKVGASTLGTRKDKLAMSMAEELGFDATMETIQQPEVQERRKGILSIQGQEQASNELAIIAKQIDRNPTIKFSRAIDEGALFFKDGLDLVNAIAAKGDLGGIVNMKKLKDGKYVGVGRYKNIPSNTIQHVVEEIYLKDKQYINTGKLLNKIAKGIPAGDARAKGFEQFVINRFKKIPGVELIVEKQSEEGVDIPDVYGKLYGQLFNVEVKLFDAQVSSLTINDINISDGTITIKKLDNLSKENKDKVNKLVAKTLPVLKKIKTRFKKLALDPRASKKDKEVLRNWNSPKDLMPNWAHITLKEEGYFKRLTQVGAFDQSLIEELYLNKAVPTNYIYMLGKGFFHIGKDVIGLNSSKLEGTFLAPIRQVKASQKSKGKKTGYVRINMRLLPTVGEITSKSSMDIMDDIDTKNFIDKDTRNRLEGKEKLIEVNQFSKAKQSSKKDKPRGMSTFDFDETLIIDGKNFVVATDPLTGDKIKISSSDWPTKGTKLAAQGYEMNFDDFVNVRGGVKGPLFQKLLNRIEKYGPNNNFILTARPQESATAIHGWLKSKGVNIPFENITGLGNSTGQAKAQWMIDKFAEGYNDMYFVDDALPNVKAVKDALEQLDIKGSSVQAKIKFSKDASIEFNEMIERTSGVEARKVFSAGEGRVRGAERGRWDLFVPPSAEDFKGLMYKFLGKGEQGNKDMKWFKDNLFDPFAKGIRTWNTYKQNMSNEYAALKNKNPKIVKSLDKKVEGTNFTTDTAIRTYLWNKNGMEIPGMAEATKKRLLDHIGKNKDLINFAETLSVISRDPDGYIQPTENWMVQTIASDLFGTVRDGRMRFLNDWVENKNTIFSKENLNKIEAIHGSGFRDALENILYRMETGTNRTVGKDKTVNKFINWVNGSVGAIMFLNIRSAALQTISTVNFINWGDNNIFKASKAFANIPQFAKDFSTIFNSDMLKQRRGGSQIDIAHSELADAFSQSRGNVESVIRWMLEKGFAPTRIADSFAISFGGASFYRNRINTYIKNGKSQKEAETQAFLDFQEVAEETQQSSRPDLISGQQAGVLGRIILPFQNTPMQMTRLMKKAALDLKNGRGDIRTNISKIIYYGAIQNLIFGALQSGLAFALFGGSEDEDDERKRTQGIRVLDGAIDTLLRGTGVYGAAIAALKNTIKQWRYERKQPWAKRDDMRIALQAVSLSPPMGSKLRKLNQAIKTEKYNKGVGKQIGFRIENPNLSIASSLVEGLTNFPMARIQHKMNNLEEAITGNHDLWKRIALSSGWSMWSVGVKDEELERAKADAKKERINNRKIEKEKQKAEEKKAEEKRKKEQGIKTVQCSGIRSNGQRCSLTTETAEKTWKCVHHMEFKDGMDRDNDGIKEYRCTAIKTNGKRCNNKTENKNKKCYAHQ